jgi:hypothetical protein
MVYLAIPFIGLGAAGFLGYTVTKTVSSKCVLLQLTPGVLPCDLLLSCCLDAVQRG